MNDSIMMEKTGKMSLVSVTPKTFDDVETAILLLKDSKSVIVYTENLVGNFAQRVMDYLSGAAFALDCELLEVAKGVYMIISGDVTVVKNN
ncbi:MAG: cell division protein SepF [Bacillota bacterium]